ncbi:MAG: MaoC family dehydratase N-terminal domain-containing protein [Pseudomonadota bacterium]
MIEAQTGAAVGRREERRGVVDALAADKLAASLRANWPGAREGEALPPLWHWAGFPDTPPQSALGPDGHPRRGGFLPEEGPPRRMWAGGALTFLQPLHVGECLRRRSTIASVTEKRGASGALLFAAVEHEIFGESGLAVTERRDIVYREAQERFTPPKAVPAPQRPLLERREPIDGVRLFRYSAALFNGHRIHYDLPYATEVERYPGLVTHGPLQAMLLMDLAISHHGAPPSRFEYRGVSPMFHFHDLALLAAEADADAGESAIFLCTAHPEERYQGMQATAVWAA